MFQYLEKYGTATNQCKALEVHVKMALAQYQWLPLCHEYAMEIDNWTLRDFLEHIGFPTEGFKILHDGDPVYFNQSIERLKEQNMMLLAGRIPVHGSNDSVRLSSARKSCT